MFYRLFSLGRLNYMGKDSDVRIFWVEASRVVLLDSSVKVEFKAIATAPVHLFWSVLSSVWHKCLFIALGQIVWGRNAWHTRGVGNTFD